MSLLRCSGASNSLFAFEILCQNGCHITILYQLRQSACQCLKRPSNRRLDELQQALLEGGSNGTRSDEQVELLLKAYLRGNYAFYFYTAM